MSTQQPNHNKGLPSGVKLNADESFELLSSARRRAILRILSKHGMMSKGELADRISEASGDKRQTVLISIHQVHLPRLQEEGVVSWKNDLVSLNPPSRGLVWYLENGPHPNVYNL